MQSRRTHIRALQRHRRSCETFIWINSSNNLASFVPRVANGARIPKWTSYRQECTRIALSSDSLSPKPVQTHYPCSISELRSLRAQPGGIFNSEIPELQENWRRRAGRQEA